MSQTLSLYRLQHTDSQIEHIQARLLAIQNCLENDTELRDAKAREESARVNFQSLSQRLKQAEQAVLNQRVKIEQTEASLYGEKGHSPKELQELQNDIAALKHHHSVLEDVQLEAMLAVEEAEKNNEIIRGSLEAATNRSAEQNLSLHNEQEALRKELQRLFSERTANADSIPAGALTLYDQLRQQRRGIAVAVISDRSCSACGSVLSPAQIQAARSAVQFALCPSCGRILYGN